MKNFEAVAELTTSRRNYFEDRDFTEQYFVITD